MWTTTPLVPRRQRRWKPALGYETNRHMNETTTARRLAERFQQWREARLECEVLAVAEGQDEADAEADKYDWNGLELLGGA